MAKSSYEKREIRFSQSDICPALSGTSHAGSGSGNGGENMGDRPNRDISWFLSFAIADGSPPTRDERLVDD